ncbi:MAG: Fic family protein [Opitutaceae bacterium]|nr:Fic family protein [Opitutaceae bacterium]
MRYIHQLPDWPHFQWSHERLTPPLAAARHRQGLLLGGMRTLGFHFRTQANLENLAAEVIMSSAIEGTVFDPAAVRSSIARRMGLPPEKETLSSREVEGAVDMLLDATQNYGQPLTEDRLLGWQAALFPAGRSGIHRIAVGQWRTPGMDPMTVVSGPTSRDQIRRKHIHFEAPTADRLQREVAAFLQWFEATDGTDPVVRAGIAHFWFVTIHPFEDGNGRVSRAIADLALARAEGSALRFYSMSSQIEQEKQGYYRVLETAQKGSLDITGWLEWFIGCFDRAVIGASGSLERIMQKAARWEQFNKIFEPNERQRKVLNALLDAGEEEISTSKFARLAGTSLDTALRDIKLMVEGGVLKPGAGGGRSTKYLLAPAAPRTLP